MAKMTEQNKGLIGVEGLIFDLGEVVAGLQNHLNKWCMILQTIFLLFINHQND